jgi:hypothetical protein
MARQSKINHEALEAFSKGLSKWVAETCSETRVRKSDGARVIVRTPVVTYYRKGAGDILTQLVAPSRKAARDAAAAMNFCKIKPM